MDVTYNINGSYKPTTKRFADLCGPDFFPTPRWATHALLDNEEFFGDIWECACGSGDMSEVIKSFGYDVYSSDLYDRGYGDVGVDFLTASRSASNIITNPPYNSAEKFIHHALNQAKRKVALLLRLAFLEGINRYNTLYSICPPSRVWVFSERITFYPSGVDRRGSGTTAYAWFVWDLEDKGVVELKWLPPIYKKSIRS